MFKLVSVGFFTTIVLSVWDIFFCTSSFPTECKSHYVALELGHIVGASVGWGIWSLFDLWCKRKKIEL